MRKFTLNRRQTLVGIGAVGAVLGFGLTARASTKTNVGVFRGVGSHAPSFIALERGYYKEAGLDVDLKFFEAAQPMAVAIASGDADYGVTSMSGGLVSLAEKNVIKVIGGALTEEKGRVGSIILASNKAYEAGLTSPKELAGKSFGNTTAGSSFHFMAYKIALANNFPLSEINLRALQKTSAIIAALSSGQIDSWAMQASVSSKMIREGAAKRIGLISDYAPDYQLTTVFTSTKNATEEREKTGAFISAYSKAVEDYNNAFVDKKADAAEVDAIARICHKYLDSDLPFEEARYNLVEGAMRINSGLALSLRSVTEQLNWFKSEGMVKDNISPEMLFDTSYVKTI